jgi:4-hydroxy-3-methylbut-2-en-1-yl diphosphate reductase
MKILRAEHLGMCFGVQDAVALALNQAQSRPLSILGELVHNETVLAALRGRGIRIAQNVEAVQTPAVMVTAHGASEVAMRRARARGLDLIEATCPLVHLAHRAVGRLVREGYYPVIIGKRDHVEVRGMTEDLDAFEVVLSEAEIEALAARPRFGVAAQTTQPIDRVRRLVVALRRRFPESEVRFIDTVCQPTKLRQHAAIELAQAAEVVVVIGGAHSNNTHELVNTCRRYCARVHHVQAMSELSEDWFAGAATVGLTAGTSTPDASINEVEQWLRQLAGRVDPASGERGKFEEVAGQWGADRNVRAPIPSPSAVQGVVSRA